MGCIHHSRCTMAHRGKSGGWKKEYQRGGRETEVGGSLRGSARLAGCGPGFPLLSPSPFPAPVIFHKWEGGGKGAREKTIYLGRAKNRAPPPPPLFSFPFFAWQKDRWEKMKRGKKKWGACSFLLPGASQRGFFIRNY